MSLKPDLVPKSHLSYTHGIVDRRVLLADDSRVIRNLLQGGAQ